MEDRIGRELRRDQLALRMIAHRARRQTICNFAGLTREKIKTLRREWHVKSEGRRRGPSPSLLSAFFRSARMRSVGAWFPAPLAIDRGARLRLYVRGPQRASLRATRTMLRRMVRLYMRSQGLRLRA